VPGGSGHHLRGVCVPGRGRVEPCVPVCHPQAVISKQRREDGERVDQTRRPPGSRWLWVERRQGNGHPRWRRRATPQPHAKAP
jgi:hypothetical protein